jgi:hypothetical protein
MKIASLRRGSVIRDPRTLSPSTDWAQDGPDLLEEFAHQSNDGRTTFDITPDARPTIAFSAVRDVLSMERDRITLAAHDIAEHYVRPTPAMIRTAYRDKIGRVLGGTPVRDA